MNDSWYLTRQLFNFSKSAQNQILGKRGPYLRFVVKVNTKALKPKPSRSRVVKLMDRGQVTQSQVEYGGNI